MDNLCIFCSATIDEKASVKLKAKGCSTINGIIKSKADKIPEVQIGQMVHKNCRRDYCRTKNIDQNQIDVSPTVMSDFKNICFFCACPATFTEARKRGIDVFKVKNTYFQGNIRKTISTRNDQWARDVQNRIGLNDLISVNAIYHQSCNTNFQNFKSLPSCYGSKIPKRTGRPANQSINAAFSKLVNHIESNIGRIFEIKDLSNFIQRQSEANEATIDNRCLKNKLLNHFGEDIMIISNKGKTDMILFRHSVKNIINQFYEQQRINDNHSEKIRIIKAAANIIKSDVLSIPNNKEEYPSSDSLASLELQKDFVPDSLYYLLDTMFSEKDSVLKNVSIGQAIMQSIRPRTIIAPLQIGLGVQMHHNFASKFLLNTLNKLGFCVSYGEVKKFERCAASTITEITHGFNQVVKFVGDNLDHNTRTIDGEGTFHGMGIIAAFTPGKDKIKPVVRTSATIHDVRSIGRIDIHSYSKDLCENQLCYERLPHNEYDNKSLNVDLLLKISWPQRRLRPSWSGVMQAINHSSHPGISSISILPLIDLSSSDPTCIYSTLLYVAREAKKLGVTPVMTFDEPLWWKAQMIIQNEPDSSDLKSIVLMLGGFHMKMNFLGAIGYFMTETGLKECLETVYAFNSVKHIFSGKSVSRAIRGHLLVDTALNTILTTITAPEISPNDDWMGILSKAAEIYDELVSLETTVDELHSNEFLTSVSLKLDFVKSKLSNCRTAKLWMQYMDMIDILRDFIRAERTGNWKLHLSTVRKMLPYFAAAGHHLYTKCGYLYLQLMDRLEKDHPDVYEHFTRGHHVIRRSDRYWAGLSCDLCIEQHLMRAAKSKAGFTRGRGINEDQRLIWVQSMPACSEFNISMQQITNLYYETSEQHKDCSEARQNRDEKDTTSILEFLTMRNPFSTENESLINIFTGMEANKNVNVDDAVEIGNKVISKLLNKKVSEYKFKVVDKAITMNDKNSVIIDGEAVQIDPEILFQRLMLVSRNMDNDKFKDAFRFELSQKPSSLFDDCGFLREAKTITLVKEMMKLSGRNTEEKSNREHNGRYVLAGSTLLKHITWKRNETYRDICLKYLQHVSIYDNPTIIFDNNDDFTTEDEVDFRENKGICSGNISFTEDTVFHSKKEYFLSNKSNKKRFIALLENFFIENRCTIVHGNENMLIAKTATDMAMSNNVTVLGDNADLPILLCYYLQKNSKDIIVKSDLTRKKATNEWNITNMTRGLGDDITDKILFIHAICGCGTTSNLHGVGKAASFKKMLTHAEFGNIINIFKDSSSRKSEIVEAGNRALVMLYNGRVGEDLDALRHRLFEEKLASKKSSVLVHFLPPTKAAAKYHSLRVFLQVQSWMGNSTLNPEEYGWIKDGRLKPRTTDLAPAPSELLSSIRCRCKGNCDNLRCTCFKNQISCSLACSECRGVSCCNSMLSNVDDDDDDDIIDGEF